jgi:integrase
VKNRYRLVRRAYGIYYCLDKQTRKKESLETSDRVKAERLLMAKNQSVEQPALNKGMAKVYLSASSPEFATRTWSDVMEHYVKSGVESTRDRKERAFRSRPFAALKMTKLIDTEASHFLNAIEHKQAGNSTHHYLRRLHNYAMYLGWLISPVMAEAAWPAMRKKKFTAITEEEHERIVAKEGNTERRLYYQMLWETGGSQTDIACLGRHQIDLERGVIQFIRRKLMGKDGGNSFLRIGPRLSALLAQLPQSGDLFPTLKLEEAKHRSAEFRRRCRTLKIQGRTLHSYRYSWAQRAQEAGMPEREAMTHLGHKSRAIHAAYADGAHVAVLPLEFYQAEKEKKIIRFDQTAEATLSPNAELGLKANNV